MQKRKSVKITFALVVLTTVAWCGTPACQGSAAETLQISRDSGGYDIQITGTTGQSWNLLTSTNLSTWMPLATNQTDSGGTAVFHETNTAGPQRYYRARLLTPALGPITYIVGATDLWDNGFDNVATPRQSVYSRFVFTTTSPSITVNGTTTDYATHPQWAQLGLRIDGRDQIPPPIVFSTNGDQSFTVTLGSAGVSRLIEIVAGYQSNPSHPAQSGVLGDYINSVTYSNSYAFAVQSQAISNRVLIYGDSITAGASATYPEYQGFPALLRSAYNYSVAVDAWGFRSLKDDASTATLGSALASHLASYNPSTIVIVIGANDYGVANEWNAANFGAAYAALVDDLHTLLSSARIICVTPFVQRTETANSFGNTLNDYRAQISAACNARTWTQLVDGSSILTVADLDPSSNVHPSTDGHAKIAAAFASILK